MRVRTPRPLNGAEVEADALPTESLLAVLRRDFGILSVRETCWIGVCGACTALVDGQPISACLLFAPLAGGSSVVTAEGLAAITRCSAHSRTRTPSSAASARPA